MENVTRGDCGRSGFGVLLSVLRILNLTIPAFARGCLTAASVSIFSASQVFFLE